jgi:phage tail-like protein
MATDDVIIRQTNYVTANRFYVEIESAPSASFSECSAISVKIKYETIREGGVNDQQRILLGQPEFSEVTLKRGVTNDFSFWGWISNVMQYPRQRRNVNIIVRNQSSEVVQCWTLIGAVPVGWTAPALQASANEVAIEELVLAYEGLDVSNSGGGGAIYKAVGRDPKSGYF